MKYWCKRMFVTQALQNKEGVMTLRMMEKWPIGMVLAVTSALVAIKSLLIPAYHSTDFEVHRYWMAITWNKKLVNWYTESTSEWTLDYPPFFAYFEYVLAYIANFIGLTDILKISKEPIFSRNILIFQRSSVIVTDLFYVFACYIYSFNSPKLTERIPMKLRSRARISCFLMLSCLQALLIVDSIHFQYNSMLTTFFIFSVYFIDQERYLLAAICYSVLLNFKHIYVYYALGYVFFYLSNYFKWNSLIGIFQKGISLAFVLIIPFGLSFGPFLYFGGFSSLFDIISRLFPVSRGLTHAFWAPNFWSLYNLIDLILYRLAKLLKIGNFEAPTYTSGLVQEYSHSVLPNVSSLGTLVLVVFVSFFILVSIVLKVRRSEKEENRSIDFTVFAIFSSLAFFYFGYHVHEKAIILITVPMTIFAIKDVKYIRHLILISTIASFSLFPLLFTKFEVFIKYSIAGGYFLMQLVLMKWFTRAPISTILPVRHKIYFGLLFLVEIYNTFIHKLIFENNFEFAPLMAISILTSIGILSFSISLIFNISFSGKLRTTWEMGKCRVREELIKENTYSVQSVEDESDVRLVAGVDISASKVNPDMVFVTISVFSYPMNEHLISFCDTRILEIPYIPQYLAIREAQTVADFVNEVFKKNPKYRPDVILCDGFGQFHSRGCGMACHIGALTGIPSVGVAKNLPLHEIYRVVGEENRKIVDIFMEKLRNVHKENSNKIGYTPFDIVLPCKLNIVRIGSSMSGVFVSTGYGIDLETSTRVVLNTMENSTTCEPIRSADLKSRDFVRKYFDEK